MKAKSTRKSLTELKAESEEKAAIQRAFASFRRWWEPHSYDQTTGASIGGHPDARRKWVRPSDGESGWYGTEAKAAFLAQPYWNEFLDWKQAGEPTPTFTSHAIPREDADAIKTEINRIMFPIHGKNLFP